MARRSGAVARGPRSSPRSSSSAFITESLAAATKKRRHRGLLVGPQSWLVVGGRRHGRRCSSGRLRRGGRVAISRGPDRRARTKQPKCDDSTRDDGGATHRVDDCERRRARESRCRDGGRTIGGRRHFLVDSTSRGDCGSRPSRRFLAAWRSLTMLDVVQIAVVAAALTRARSPLLISRHVEWARGRRHAAKNE